jgi:hypothetical protein
LHLDFDDSWLGILDNRRGISLEEGAGQKEEGNGSENNTNRANEWQKLGEWLFSHGVETAG